MVQPNIMQDRLQELFPVHYRNGNVLMINADCMEVMKHIKDKEVDLSCVDPPYGIERFKDAQPTRLNRYGQVGTANDERPTPEYVAELKRVATNQIVWGYNHLADLLGATKEFVFWYKHQPVISYADGELAWTSFTRTARCFDYPFFGCTGREQNRIHPTQKPVALYKWLLKNYAKPGDKILDTHGGSGSICIACHDLGYDLTWMELDADYYEAACKRYKTHAAQTSLFDPAELTKEAKEGELF